MLDVGDQDLITISLMRSNSADWNQRSQGGFLDRMGPSQPPDSGVVSPPVGVYSSINCAKGSAGSALSNFEKSVVIDVHAFQNRVIRW